MITDYKILESDFTNRDIMGLPDKPSEAGVGASALKERFDAGAKRVVSPKLNSLIDFLATSGADGIGATITGISGTNVAEVLANLLALTNTKAGTEVTNEALALKANEADYVTTINNVTFDANTGVFTFSRKNGTSFTIDTLLEKVVLDVALEGQQLVLTLKDGTKQYADLSAFITDTELVAGTGITITKDTTGKFTVSIKNKGITINELSDALVSYIDAGKTSAQEYSEQAQASATASATSASSAQGYAEEAEQAKQQACTCATNAGVSENNVASMERTISDIQGNVTALEQSVAEKATQASNSATQALTSVTSAMASATSASNSANSASGYATQASNSASDAQGYAETARQTVQGLQGYVDSASGYATLAQGYANDAQSYATQAGDTVTTVQGYATQANQSAEEARQSAQSINPDAYAPAVHTHIPSDVGCIGLSGGTMNADAVIQFNGTASGIDIHANNGAGAIGRGRMWKNGIYTYLADYENETTDKYKAYVVADQNSPEYAYKVYMKLSNGNSGNWYVHGSHNVYAGNLDGMTVGLPRACYYNQYE